MVKQEQQAGALGSHFVSRSACTSKFKDLIKDPQYAHVKARFQKANALKTGKNKAKTVLYDALEEFGTFDCPHFEDFKIMEKLDKEQDEEGWETWLQFVKGVGEAIHMQPLKLPKATKRTYQCPN